jgi:hypothetical protein
MNIMYKSKDLTGNTPQSSSGESTGGKAQPSLQSARTDSMPTSTQTMNPQSHPMLSPEPPDLTTLPTTEKARQHAMVAKVALLFLLKTGLVRRFTVLSEDRTTVKEIRVVFDPGLWTQDFDLK